MAETKNTKEFYNTEIPSDWEIMELKNCSEFITKGATPTTYGFSWVENGILFLRSECVSERGIELAAAMFISEEADKMMNRSSLKDEDILMTITGNIGRVCLLPKEFPKANINQHIARIRIKNDIYNRSFIFQYLKQEKIQNEYLKITTGQAYPQISLEQVRGTKILLPPLPEQKAIAQVLSTADAAIHTTEKLIAQKELRKKWLMQQLLTGKKRLKGFVGEWKEFSYEKLLKVVKRNFYWDENELYKLISVRRRSGGIFYREALYGHQILVKTLRTASEGDFLFSKMQILHGASALVTKEFDGAKISGSYIAVVPKEKKQLNMEFFQWYSQTPYFYHQTYISSYGVHIEKMTFDFDTFLQLEMKLPSIEEQTAIAQVLQAADKEISLLKAKAEKLREQKKGLMQQLLTGKVRLKIKNEII